MPTNMFVTKLIDNQNGDEIRVSDIDNVVDEYKAGAFIADIAAADGAKVVDVGATRAASALYAGTATITTSTGDIKGDVLAADNTKVVDSGSTQGASTITAGTAVITDATVSGLDAISTYGPMKYQDFYKAVPAATAIAVHAAITLADGSTTVVTTAITNPTKYRVLSVTGNQAGVAGDVVITGTDWGGHNITDTIVANGGNTVNGVFIKDEK